VIASAVVGDATCGWICLPAAPADYLLTMGTILNQRPEVFRAVLGAPNIR